VASDVVGRWEDLNGAQEERQVCVCGRNMGVKWFPWKLIFEPDINVTIAIHYILTFCWITVTP